MPSHIPGNSKLHNDVRQVLLGDEHLSDAAKRAANEIVNNLEKLLRDPVAHNKELFLVATRRVMTSSDVDVKKELITVLARVRDALDTRLNQLSEVNAQHKQVLTSTKDDINDIKSNFKPRR